MASGHSRPPAGPRPPWKAPPWKAPPTPPGDFFKIMKQAVAPQAPSPPAAPGDLEEYSKLGKLVQEDLEEYSKLGELVQEEHSRQRRPPGMPGVGPAKLRPPPGMPAFGPAVAPPDWRPGVQDKIQQLKLKKQLREGKFAHLRSEPSSSSGPMVATVGTGAPSSRPLAATGLHQAGDPKTRRPLAAGDPKTLGQDVADHVETHRRTPGAWKPTSITKRRLPAVCAIRYRLHEELGRELEGQTAGSLCHILTGPRKDYKAVCIPVVGNEPQKIGDCLETALEKHPLVCSSSIGRKVRDNGMHQLVFTDMHNSRWVLIVLPMPEKLHFHFSAVLQTYNAMQRMTNTEAATMGNLLCSLTGHAPHWPNAMGGSNSGDPNVGNDLAQAAAEHDSEQSAIGDMSVRESSGPLSPPMGDDAPESDSVGEDSPSEEALPEADFGEPSDHDSDSESPHAGAQGDCATGSDDKVGAHEDDPHVDPDRGGGGLL